MCPLLQSKPSTLISSRELAPTETDVHPSGVGPPIDHEDFSTHPTLSNVWDFDNFVLLKLF